MKNILVFNFLLALLPTTIFAQDGELSHDKPSLKNNIVVEDEDQPSLSDKIAVVSEKTEFLQEKISYYSNKLKGHSKSLVALGAGACVTTFMYSLLIKKLKMQPKPIDHLAFGFVSFELGLLTSMFVKRALNHLSL